jgi:hypothetical protein
LSTTAVTKSMIVFNQIQELATRVLVVALF